MADKREIKAIRALLSKYKISLKDLQGIIKGGKGVSKRNDEILKRYRIVRGPVGKVVRGMQDYNKQSREEATTEGRSSSYLGRLLHSESRIPTVLKDKETITPKDVEGLRNFYKMSKLDFERVIAGNPQTDFENKVYSDSKEIFTPDKMKRLPETAKKDSSLVQFYNKLRDATSGSKYTQDQQDVNQRLLQVLAGQKDPTAEEVADKKYQNPVEKEVAGLLGKTGLSPKVTDAIAENLPAFAQAYQQSGYEQRPQFGAPTDSSLLRGYDNLINLIRPQEGGASKFARKYRPMTNLAAGIGGQAGGAALGSIIGMPTIGGQAGGLLGGLGANTLTNYLTQEKPELTRLADLLRGGEAGYFSRGKRGLADIIAGTQGKQEKVDRALDVIGRLVTGGDPFNWFNTQKDPSTRFQRFRRDLASPVRGLGNLLGSPNAAGNIRAGLGIAQGLYDFGNETGINNWISNKLGFQQRPQYVHTGFETGEQLANPIIAGAVARAIPFLQEQTSRILGRNVAPQEVIGDLDARLRDVLMPQVMQRNIQRSNEDITRRLVQQRVNIEAANQQARQAQSQLQGQEQLQNFEHKRQMNEQQAMEANLQARLGIRANQLAAQQAALGQEITPQAPLRRVVQEPTRLWNIAEGVGKVIDPISGKLLAR